MHTATSSAHDFLVLRRGLPLVIKTGIINAKGVTITRMWVR
jgi:hypothetical protein